MREDERDEPSGRVTNQDLARRLDRVEDVQEKHGLRLHELGNEVGVVKLQVEHAQEMIRIRFAALESAVQAVTTKLDTLLERGEVRQADPAATPAGRALLAEINDLKEWKGEASKTIDAARGLITAWRIVAGGSLLTTVAAGMALAAALGAFGSP